MNKGWIGVDLDGTLVEYSTWISGSHVGDPVPAMLARVKQWLKEGEEVRIFTARIHPLDRCVGPEEVRQLHGTYLDNSREDTCWESIQAIRIFCVRHLGQVLPITNVKDFGMKVLWDDRCIQVHPNTGKLATDTAFASGVEASDRQENKGI